MCVCVRVYVSVRIECVVKQEESQVNLYCLVSLVRRHGEVVSPKAPAGTDGVCGAGGLVLGELHHHYAEEMV